MSRSTDSEETKRLKPSCLMGCLAPLLFLTGIVLLPISLFFVPAEARLWIFGAIPLSLLAAIFVLRRWLNRLTKWSESKNRQFWAWFVANEAEYRTLSVHDFVGQMEALQSISERLQSDVHTDLTCELGLPASGSNGKATLVLSAGGVPRMVGFLKPLMEIAPTIDGWNFVMLKPRKGIPPNLVYAGAEYDPDDIAYYLRPSTPRPPDEEADDDESDVDDELGDEGEKKAKLDLNCYIPGYVEAEGENDRGAALTLVTLILGEKDFMRLGKIIFVPLDRNAPPADGRSVRELANDYDQRRAAMPLLPKPAAAK